MFLYWYQLLKIIGKYGEIEKFDICVHRAGPLYGKSKGYAFVTYKNKECAYKAIAELHGRYILSKRIVVKTATSTEEGYSVSNKSLNTLGTLPGLVGPQFTESDIDKKRKIREIESKLEIMEKYPDLTTPTVIKNTFKSNQEPFRMEKKHHSRNSKNSEPYNIKLRRN